MKPSSRILIALLTGVLANAIVTKAQGLGPVCGDPRIHCSASYSFMPYQMPFTIKEKLIYGKTYKSRPFYVVFLKSVKVTGESDCSYINENERLEVQAIWPTRKVFTSRFSCPEELVLYENTHQSFNFLAIYAGTTLNEARRVLKEIRTNGRYPHAYMKRIQAVLEYST